MPLQHILGDGKAFVLHPGLAWLLGHHLQSGEFGERLVEAFVTILLRSRSELALQDSDLAFSISNLADVLTQRARSGNAIRGNKSVPGIVRRRSVHANNGNTGRLC